MAVFHLELANNTETNQMVLRLAGHVGFENCVDVVREGEQKLLTCKANDRVALDVSGVENAQSVLLSVLLRWLTVSEKHNLQMSVIGLSGKMFEVARVSGIETVLPLSHT